MPKNFLLYLNDEERKKLDRIVAREQKINPKISASDVVKRSLFSRRARKVGQIVPVNDLVFQAHITTALNTIYADYKRNLDITENLVKLINLVKEQTC